MRHSDGLDHRLRPCPGRHRRDETAVRRGTGRLFQILAFLILALGAGQAFAMKAYLNDVIATFSDTSRFDVCGDCHSSWTGGKARGDLAITFKIWDYDTGNAGMSKAMRKVDMFNIGYSNEWRVQYQTSNAPFPFTGAADKDGDGYINLIYRTERAGMPINHTDVCSTCTAQKSGGSSGSLATKPAGWDIDDNDPTQGNIPWNWNSWGSTGRQNEIDTIYRSTDTVPPNSVKDLRLDLAWIDANSGGVMPSNALPLTWTAPADDDPAIGGPDINVPVHHYDLRYTTQTILNTYNTGHAGLTPPKLCSGIDEQNGQDPCQLRDEVHWHTMFHISDCGVNNGSGQEHLMHMGVMDGANANACVSGVNGWNRGEGAPLMRALYETGFEDYDPNDAPYNNVTTYLATGPTSPIGPPFGPKTPGSTENYVLQEITQKHRDISTGTPYVDSGIFVYTDKHDGVTNTRPNYLAPDTVYWLTVTSDDSVVHPCIEEVGNERVSTMAAFCQPSAGDGIIYDGPFVEAGTGLGFAGYEDPGFQEHGNIIAMKTGGATPGAAITSISPSTGNADGAQPVTVNLTGIGFTGGGNVNSNQVVLTDTFGNVVVAGTNIVRTNDRALSVDFNVGALPGVYTVEMRTSGGATTAAWVDGFEAVSVSPGDVQFSVAAYSALENAGVATIAVTRTGGKTGQIDIDYATADGTATLADNDYVAASGTITFLDQDNATKTFNVTIVNDAVLEPDETVNLSLSNPRLNTLSDPTVLGVQNTAVLTIQNDENNPGTVEFSATGYSVNETTGGTTVTITVNRVGGSDGAITVDAYTQDLAPGPTAATANSDYTEIPPGAPVTLIWAGGDAAAKTFTVDILNDALQESNEDFQVWLTNPTGGTSITGTNPSTVTIIDDDTPATLDFSAATYVVDEGGASIQIDVTRTGNTVGAVSVDYATSNGTATAAVDYTAAIGTLNWGDGVGGIQSFSVPIIEDSGAPEDEQNETVTLTLSNFTGGAAAGPNNPATLTINDNDSTLQFSNATYTVAENGVSVTITATRVDATTPPTYAGAVGVSYATSDGSAVNGGGAGLGDYDTATGTLAWADGVSTGQTFSVTINDDALLEGDETVNLALTGPTGDATGQAGLGTPNTAVLTISDNEAPGTVQFDSATYTEREDGGVNATITVTRIGGNAGTVTVDYATADGATNPATAGSDYTATSGTLTWNDGDTTSKTFTVVILNDAVDEADETVDLTLSNTTVNATPDGTLLGTPSTATLTIIDSYGTLQFDNTGYTVDEDGGVSAVITVTRVGGSNQAVSIDYATANGAVNPATAGSDYTGVSGTLNWADADAAAKTFSIPIINDSTDEVDETVDLALSNPRVNAVAEATLLGTPNAATLTIIDSHGTLQFGAPTYSVNEDGGVTADITVTRVGGTNGALTVDYATADGTAVTTGADNTNGLRDYEPTSGTLSWADADGASKVISVPINNDAINEQPDETFTLALTNPTLNLGADASVLGAQTSTTVTIVDSFGALQFSNASYSVAEDGSGLVTLTVTRVGGTNQAISVDYATSNGTAVAPGDYTTTSGTLNWADGDAVSKTFTVPIVNDAIDENPDETFTVALSNPTGGAQLGATTTATVTIVDSLGDIEFSSATYSVNEDGGVDATITVNRVGGSNGTAFVDYATADGAVNPASAGIDYTTASGTLSWADGDSAAKTFTVPIINDAIAEDPDETVDLTLSNVIGARTGATMAATLTIVDSLGTLQFTNASYSVAEDGSGSLTVTVTRVGGSNQAISVDYATSNGTAIAPGDYTATTGTLSWLDADTASKTFVIPIINDAIDENPDETFTVALSNPTGGAQLGTPNSATVTIIDSLGDIQFSSAAYNVNEDGSGSVIITVDRAGGSNGAASVNYATSNGTATAGSDYTAASGTFSWLDGDSTSKTFSVNITNDILVEPGGETVNLSLSGVTGARSGTPLAAVLTIIDSVGRVEFVSPPYTVTEDTAGAVVVTARRVEGSGGAFNVPYATSDGTATTADNDYVAASGSLAWADGEIGNKTFTVTVNSDRNIEADESLNLGLTPPAQAPVNTTLTISNDDFTGAVQFSVAGYTVDETGINATISVTRSGGDVGAITVDYATSDGTAVTTEVNNNNGLRDYEPTAGTLSWLDADAATKTISVPINDDLIIEGGESLNLALSNPTLNSVSDPTVLGTPNTATLTITDDDAPGTVQFSAATYTVNEDGGINADITVTRVGGNGGTLTIDYATANGAVNPATAGVDYTAQSGTFTWTPGDTSSRTISIPVVNDAIVESPDETIDLSLSNPTLDAAPDGAVLGAPSTATLTIIDSYGTLQFDNTGYQITEDGGVDAVITVTRVGGSNQAISVDYTTADNTATAGLDYTTSTGTLSWAAGDTASKTFNVPVINDAITESPDEVVNLVLSNTKVNGAATAFVLGTPNTATLTIVDSVGDLQFSGATYSVTEDGGVAATITVTRVGGINGDVTIDYATSDGTATAGADYTAVSGTLNWLSGDGASKTFTVAVIDDAINEVDETVNLTLTNPTLNTLSEPAILGSPNTATLTIVDSLGKIEFSSPTYSVNEDGGVDATITVNRVGGSNGAASVDYATGGGTATAGVDFTAVSGTLNWADGISSAKTFTIPITNDAIVEDPDETVDLTLSNVGGAWLGTQTTATLTIIDSAGTLQFSNATYSVVEDGSATATITVNRVGGNNGAASVNYVSANGTAVAPGDYTAVGGTLSWIDGDQAAKTFTVPIVNDAVNESSETVILSLSGFTGATAGAPTTATLTIVDSYGVIQFSAPTYTVNEDGGVDATITVDRVGGTNGAAAVNYASANGAVNPATAGVDYTAVSGTLNWATGDGASKTFTVPVFDDPNDEPDETIDLTLSGVSGAWLGGQNTAVLTLIDSLGTLQFAAPTYTVNEDGGPGVATITVTRVGGSNGAATVDYTTVNGTATAPGDYTLTTGTLSWADGDKTSKSFNVPIVNDSTSEIDESFSIALSNVTGAWLGGQTSTTVTIVDSYGTIQFSAPAYTISETGTSLTVTVSRVGGDNGAASVDYATSDGSATAGVDYTARSGTFSWADGDKTDRIFTIPIVNDALNEGDETINLSLTNVVGAWPGSPNNAIVTITDNPGSLQFSTASYSVNETTPSVTITVTRSGGSGGAASVNYATADGTAVAGAPGAGDYDAVSGTLNWANGDAASKTFTIPIHSDLLAEGGETVALSLSGATGGVLGAQSSSTLTINDSPGLLQFSVANYNVSEDGSGVATITVSRVEGSGGAAAVNYATADADPATTATVGADYVTTAGTLSWVDGDSADKSFNIPVYWDSVVEDPDEQVKLTLSGVTGAALGAPIQAFLTIIDSAGTLQFSSPTYSIAETGVSATVTVTRIGGSNGAASVVYATADGTATAGSDYTATTGTLNWADADAAAKTFTISVQDDAVVEGDETVNLSLSSATGAQLAAPSTAVLTIIEDDIAGNLEFASAVYSVNEDGAGFATLTVRRTLGSQGTVTVDYATSDGSAVAGSDYTATSGTLVWTDGDTANKTFTVPITADTLIEAGGEVVNLSLSNPTGGATLNQGGTAQQTALLSIVDSVGSLRFSSATFSENENVSTATITVQRVNGSGGAVTVDYATSDGTATGGADYTPISGTVSWAADDTTTKTFTVTLLDDLLIEANETVNLTLSNPTGGATVTTPSTATLTIVNDDATGSLQFSAATYSVFENAGVITVNVKRVGGSVGAVAVYYQTATDGGGANPATAGNDYVSIPPTRLDWADGDTADKTFNVIISDEANFEPDETLAVVLSNPVGGTLGTPTTAVVTITNDDSPLPVTLTVQPGWSMISIPTDLATDPNMASIFYDDFGMLPAIYRWISGGVPGTFSGVYSLADTGVPGAGYFLLNERTVSIIIDDQFNGLQTGDPFEITLQVGGNMIGNPYQTAKDLLVDVRVCNFTVSGCALSTDWVSWATATGNGWVTGTIYRYDTVNGTYTMKNPVDGTMIMSPWEGYWVRTEVTDDLRVRFYDAAVPP